MDSYNFHNERIGNNDGPLEHICPPLLRFLLPTMVTKGWRAAVILPFNKGKRGRTYCYCSTVGCWQIFSPVWINTLQMTSYLNLNAAFVLVEKEQCIWFFTATQTQKCYEQNVKLSILFEGTLLEVVDKLVHCSNIPGCSCSLDDEISLKPLRATDSFRALESYVW